jgi:queuine tRNA-ribosyltransferase
MAQFKLIKQLKSGVRVGRLSTPSGVIQTPFFMPVGTVGSVKGVSSEELKAIGAEIVLANAYHLYLRPGEKLIKKLGGLHKFMNWDKPILTDSGGYQVFSLGGKGNPKSEIQNPKQILNLKNSNNKNVLDLNNSDFDIVSDLDIRYSDFDPNSLVRITDDGVEFRSHLDGLKHFFTPEKVIQIQLDLSVDILMPLDVCPSGKASYEEVKRATDLTVKWAERAKKYFDKKMRSARRVTRSASGVVRPILHGIVQGGLYPDLRKECAEKLIKMDFDGYSVGGLAVDLETREMWDIVKLMGEMLPKDKQRYLMGVGTPDDIIKATSLGMDMFDCVLPTRLARHGSVYCQKNPKSEIRNPKQILNVKKENSKYVSDLDIRDLNFRYELLNLQNAKYRSDGGVIDENCGCPVCRVPKNDKVREIPSKPRHSGAKGDSGGYSRAYISHLLKSKEILGLRLASLHNLHVYLELMRKLKKED